MSEKTSIARSGRSGRFTMEPLGKSKAAKFAAVEGLSLTPASEKTSTSLEACGLKGDAYRSAVAGAFKAKRNG